MDLRNHTYRGVAGTPVQDFETATTEGEKSTSNGHKDAEILMCGASNCGSAEHKQCQLERSCEEEEDYILKPSPKHKFEPNN